VPSATTNFRLDAIGYAGQLEQAVEFGQAPEALGLAPSAVRGAAARTRTRRARPGRPRPVDITTPSATAAQAPDAA
jgi:hypothetical protein